jgi:hypothetical protein
MPGIKDLLRNAVGKDQAHAGKTGFDTKETSEALS